MDWLKKNYKFLITMFFIVFSIGFLVYLLTNYTGIFMHRIELYNIKVKGYKLNPEFDPINYEYSLTVDENKIEISCESDKKIKDCDKTIDLTNKKEYTHKVKVYDGLNVNTYKIKITNSNNSSTNHGEKKDKTDEIETPKQQEKKSFEIKEVTGNPTKYTNKDVTLEVKMSDKDNYTYSFDGGNTFQESNKYLVKENTTLKIFAKKDNGDLSNVKSVEVDKIDKVKPVVTIHKSSSTSTKVKLQILAYDDKSGISKINFNGKESSNKKEYEVTKAGKYYVEVTDVAGNKSEKVYIEITKDDFSNKIKSKTFKINFEGNGASVEKKQMTCTTTENSCEIILPKIITTHSVAGWSTNKDSKGAQYPVGGKLVVSNDMTLYAITKKEFTINYIANGAIGVEKLADTCVSYNAEKCEVVLPNILSYGTIIGWNTDKNATKKKYAVGQKIELTSNTNLYAITQKKFTATFEENGAKLLGEKTLTCGPVYNTQNCEIKLPKFRAKNAGQVIGWNTNSEATTAEYHTGQTINLEQNMTLYAITKYIYVATFDTTDLEYIEIEGNTLNCTAYNTKSCDIILPVFNSKGKFSRFWSTEKITDYSSASRKKSWFNDVRKSYTLNESKTFYPNFYYSESDTNTVDRYRNIKVSSYKKDPNGPGNFKIGNTIFEFEIVLSNTYIDTMYNRLIEVNKTMPYLFKVPKKVFFLSGQTFDSVSYTGTGGIADYLDNVNYVHIDVKFEIPERDFKKTVHELGHAWDDSYYAQNSSKLHDSTDFNDFYNLVYDKIVITKYGTKLSKIEFLAEMVANYYLHYHLGDKKAKEMGLKTNWGLDESKHLSDKEWEQFKKFILKYKDYPIN